MAIKLPHCKKNEYISGEIQGATTRLRLFCLVLAIFPKEGKSIWMLNCENSI